MKSRRSTPMNDLTKLPKWAQEHIKDLQMQRDTAVSVVEEHCETQVPSPFKFESLSCETSPPSHRTFYVDAHGLVVTHNGVELSIILRDNIDLQWGVAGGFRLNGEVSFVPISYMMASLERIRGQQKETEVEEAGC